MPPRVMIRGIPKEGWKLITKQLLLIVFPQVMIRGIPKEGWKLAVGGGAGHAGWQCDDQRNP